MNVLLIKRKEDKANTITEMCKMFQVSARTLRFTIKRAIISDQKRSTSLFTKSDRGRMKLIMQGKRFGFSLEEIRQLLNLHNFGDHRTRQIKQTYQLGLTRLSSMEQQKERVGHRYKRPKNTTSALKHLFSRGERTLKTFNFNLRETMHAYHPPLEDQLDPSPFS